jgi:hypothetical protein
MHPGESPHGASLKVFVNDIAMKAIKDNTMPLPIGSIAVKENDAKDKETVATVTPMDIAAGFNPDAGNGVWLNTRPAVRYRLPVKSKAVLTAMKKPEIRIGYLPLRKWNNRYIFQR